MVKRSWLGMAFAGIVMLAGFAGLRAEDKAAPAEAEVARARKTVQMLDDVYKTAVVLITDKYVHSEDDFPAGGAAIALFDQISKKGWHQVELLDVSGEPYDDANVANDEFEKAAVEAIRAGKGFYEATEVKDGKPVYRAMTAIPVVMQKCVMCHPNYKNVKEGAAIGALSYALPME